MGIDVITRTLPTLRSIDWQGLISVTLVGFLYLALVVNLWGTDAHGYWSAFSGGLYHAPWQTHDGLSFVYPPPAALILWPFTLLPWPVFYGLLTLASMSALAWLVGWRWAGFVAVLFLPALRDLLDGNIHILLAAALASGAWPALLLTKITPGVGLLYHLVRREWRLLALTAGITAGLCLLSVLVLGVGAWRDWFGLLSEGAGRTAQNGSLPVPFLVRLPIAIACIVAALRWRPMMAVGVMLALPAVWWSSPALLLAMPRLSRDRP